MNGSRPRICVYIDADNVAPQWIESVFGLLEPRWDAYLRRAYGANLAGHKVICRQCGILAVEVFPPTKGKNAADHALIIDAMRELYHGLADSICIVSADGDFTRLAQAWREEGKDVLAFGPNHTPLALRSACTEFGELGTDSSRTNTHIETKDTLDTPRTNDEGALLNELTATIAGLIQAEREVTVGNLSLAIRQQMPGFAPRNYRAKTMTKLLRRLHTFELTPRKDANGGIYEYDVCLHGQSPV